MIKTISIHNFKAIQELNNINLGKINLIGGKNNAGKSSFVEGIFLYIDRHSPDVFQKLLSWRGFPRLRIEPESLWGPFFYDYSFSEEIFIELFEQADTSNKSSPGEKKRLSIVYQGNHVPKVPIPINNNGMLTSSMNGGTGFHALELTHKTNETVDFLAYPLLHNGLYYEIEKNDMIKLQTGFFVGSRMFANDDNIERLGILEKKDEQEKIIPFLRRFEPSLTRLQVIKEGQQDIIYADLGNRKKVPVNFLGDGFCRCLTIALLLTANTPDFLLIDEIGSGIHFSLLNTFWQFIIDTAAVTDCQIITTTHSYEMIQAFGEAMKEKSFNDAAYIRLEKQNDVVSAFQFNADELGFALDSEMEVR
ncbi:MAG: AAA family ATPase [Prevotella sp.]|jgi:AAA15 family ATPase/GTPase|nr:AAA family ATPase [Prevotella sp.]